MFNLPLAATWELVQTKFRSSFRFARLFSYLGACSARAAAWNQVYPYTARAFHRELAQTKSRSSFRFAARRSKRSSKNVSLACFLIWELVLWELVQTVPRCTGNSIALRVPYYTESGHQNQHICLIFSNMCSILEPQSRELWRGGESRRSLPIGNPSTPVSGKIRAFVTMRGFRCY